jgi:outer membrane murein-binding lipoprotein Lpp
MKKNMLLKPLINSVLILGLFSLLIYLIAGSPEATVWSSLWSSLGMIVTGILRTIQWIIAMLLALLVCLAFLFAIFFGAVALFDKKTSVKMYSNLKTLLLSGLPSFTGQCCCCSTASTQSSQEEVKAEEVKAEETLAAEQEREAMNAEINNVREHLHTTRQVLTDKIDQITSRIDSLEAMTTDMANKQQLDDMSHEVQGAVDSLAGIQSAVSAMQSCVDQTGNQLQEISPNKILGDLPQRIQTLEEQQSAAEVPEPVDITPLQNDINAMQSELIQVKEKANKALQAATDNTVAPAAPATPATQAIQEAPESTPESAPAPSAAPTASAASAPPVAPTPAVSEEEEEEHRIFSYFDNPADKEKLAELVASTLGKDMSYKHALNYITKELGPVKGKIISSHPSLSKDYIRQCRKNN